MKKNVTDEQCITKIDIMRPVDIETLNRFIENNDTSYSLIKKRMFENIRRGHINSALEDAERLSMEIPAIETKLIIARLYLCVGQIDKSLSKLDRCIECSKLCSTLLKITKLDGEFLRALQNDMSELELVRQDYIIQSLTVSNRENMWVYFMPYIISQINKNSEEAEDWLNILINGDEKIVGELARELKYQDIKIFKNDEYKGLYNFILWSKNDDSEELERAISNSIFPYGSYVLAYAILNGIKNGNIN